MAILNIDDVKAGMTLAEAVRNHQDQLLLDRGRRITEKSIRIFKSWGIRRVAVTSGPVGDDPGDGLAAAELTSAVEEVLRARFVDHLNDPLMVAIMQAAGRQLAVRQGKKKTPDVRS
jgi:NAD(P)H-hydrate repair Nnr-like enzyme with NAD(P)H-hydrate epimerase domain